MNVKNALLVSRRDLFVAAALAGRASSPADTFSAVAYDAVALADATIAELDKTPVRRVEAQKGEGRGGK